MTHTCCTIESDELPKADGNMESQSIPLLLVFQGDVASIQEEEQDLGLRLEELIFRFNAEYDSTQTTLEDFVYRSWRLKMTEECLPSSSARDDLRNAEVWPDATCKCRV